MCCRIHKLVFIWFWNKINFTTWKILAGKSHKSGQILNSPYDSDKTFSYSPSLRFYIVFGQNWWTPSWWLKFPPVNQGVPIWNEAGCGRVSGFLKRGELELRSSLSLLLSQTQFHNRNFFSTWRQWEWTPIPWWWHQLRPLPARNSGSVSAVYWSSRVQ